MKIDKTLSIILILTFVKVGFSQFVSVSTPTDETCIGNGVITTDISNTQSGAVFEFVYYKLPNTTVPYRTVSGVASGGTSFSHVENSFPIGDYQINITENVGGVLDNETNTVTIVNVFENLSYNFSLIPLCSGADIVVNVSSGHPDSYELRDLSNNIVIAPQDSNVLSSVPAGDYNIRVIDSCGNAQALGVTVSNVAPNYTFDNNNGSYGFFTLHNCDTMLHVNRIRSNGSHSFPDAYFPINIEYRVTNPGGGPDFVINSVWNSNADNSETIYIPYYDGQTYTYTATITDACGNTETRNQTITGGLQFRFRPLTTTSCGTKFIEHTLFQKLVYPVTVTYTSYPAGFDPANFNSNFTLGTYTATLNAYSALNIGNSTTSVPEGSYTVEVTDACGYSKNQTIVVGNSVNFLLVKRRIYAGCSDDEGSLNLYIRSTTGGSAQTANIDTMRIISAPVGYPNPLPDDVSGNIASNGQFYMANLPVGTYTFEAVTDCGPSVTANFDILPADLTYSITPTYNCGSFNLAASATSRFGDFDLYLQQYFPSQGQWGKPVVGTLYTPGNQMGSTTADLIAGVSNNGGLLTATGTLNNINATGLFRVVLQSLRYQNGGTTAGVRDCRKVLETFTISSSGISLNNYYVFNCFNGNTELVIDAVGVAPLNYQITSFNGSPLNINNGTSPVFTDLSSGQYTVDVTDGCGNTRAFTMRTDRAKSPVIRPQNLCNGQNGSLYVSGLSFLNIDWRKDGDPTILATGNTLSFAPFNDPGDIGNYTATLSYPADPSACLNSVLTFSIPASGTLPNAGSGQTVQIPQGTGGIVNLNDYLNLPFDNYGDWEEVTNSGLQTNEVWDAGSANIGNYQFLYIVPGICNGADTATVNIEILDLVNAVNDTVTVCPGMNLTDVINVMNNDSMAGLVVDQSNYTVSELVADPNGVLTINADGSVDVSSSSQNNQTYSLEYQISEISNNSNTNNGTVVVRIVVSAYCNPPNGGNEVASVNQGGTTSNIDLLANNSDPDGDSLTLGFSNGTIGTGGGVLSDNGDGTVNYTSVPGFSGIDTLVYNVCDTASPTPNCIIDTLFMYVIPDMNCEAITLFDWTDNSWTATTLNNTYQLDGISINGTVTPPTGGLVVPTPIAAPFYQGGQGIIDDQLVSAASASILEADSITYTFNLGASGTGVRGLNFELFDVDGANNGSTILYREQVRIQGFLGGSTVAPFIVGTNYHTIVGDLILADTLDAPTAGTGSALGNVGVYFQNNVDQVVISFKLQSGGTYTGGSEPGFSLYNIIFCDTINASPSQGNETLTGVTEDATIPTTSGDLTANNTDPDGTTTTVTTVVSTSGGGTATVSGGGTTIDYTPALNFNGVDTVVYTVCDAGIPLPAQCVNDTLFITVDPVNDAPSQGNETLTGVTEDATIPTTSGDLTVNNTDPDGTTTTVTTVVSTSGGGTATVSGGGTTIDYTPALNFNGVDTVIYTVCDAGTPMPAQCVNDTLFVTVDPTQDPPTGGNEIVTVDEDDSLVGVGLLDNNSDIDGDSLTVSFSNGTIGSGGGTFTDNGDGTIDYTPALNFNGIDTLVYSVCDTASPTPNCVNDTIFVTVNPINDAPTQGNETVGLNSSGSLSGVDVIANNTDPEGDNLTVTFVSNSGSVGGTFTNNNDGTVAYVPDGVGCPICAGADTLIYTVCDDGIPVECVTDTLIVNVTQNQTPIGTGTGGSGNEELAVTEDDDATISDNVLANNSDPEGDSMTVTVIDQGNGIATYNPVDSTIIYTPDTNFCGLDTILYSVCDPFSCLQDTLFVTVTCVPDAPSNGNEYVSVLEDDSLQNIGLLDNNTDGDGDSLVISFPNGTTGTGGGTFTDNGDGTINYIPLPNYNGIDTLIYTVCDTTTPIPNCVNDTIFVTITPVQDVPTIGNEYETIYEGNSLSNVDLLANNTDADNDSLVIGFPNGTTGSGGGTFTDNGDGTVGYTPVSGFTGVDTLIYTVCDTASPTPNCVNDTIFITVEPCDVNVASLDCDGDGLTNGEETTGLDDPSTPFNPNGNTSNPLDVDSDGDGVTDGDESVDQTNPTNPCDLVLSSQTLTPDTVWYSQDCDGDGVTNEQEVVDSTGLFEPCDLILANQDTLPTSAWNDTDCDNDGLTNGEEVTGVDTTGTPSNPNGNITDPFNPDTDGDGVTDGTEGIDGTNPNDPCDLIIANQTLQPSDSWNSMDCDGDSLTNGEELTGIDNPSTPAKPNGSTTDPLNPDTDGDGVTDGTEVEDGTNPNDPCSLLEESITLTVTSTTACAISIPEGFSPNGDGVNDYFVIEGIENYEKVNVMIMNRWGNKVYESSDYQNDWDGTNKFGISVGGHALPPSTYFYIIDLGDGEEVKKGYIYLNR